MKRTITIERGPTKRVYSWIAFMMLFFTANIAWAQTKMVSGTVTSSEDGEPLPGVNISIKGTTEGTISDFEGNFKLEVPSEESILVFSFIGYNAKEITVGTQSKFDVALTLDVEQLEEIVVVGYGVQKKSVVTGAIASVKSEDIVETPITNAGMALQGRTPGVTVSQVSGAPGSGINIRVRGTGSNGNNTPLYVVDGLQMDNIDFLNPNDIESIEVLKDAASAAIYGSRGANGVVLVTTKKGKSGGLRVTYDGYYGVQEAWRKMPVLNSYEYMMLHNEGFINDGFSPVYSPETIANNTVDTDWQDEILQTAPMQSHYMSFGGGNEMSTAMLSLGYLSQDGIVGGGDKSNYERISIKLSGEHKLSEYFTVGSNVNYVRENRQGISEQNEFGGVLQNAIIHDPLTPVYETDADVIAGYDTMSISPVRNSDGQYYGISDKGLREIVNPLARLENTYNEDTFSKFFGNAYLEVKPWLEGLKFRTDLGFEIGNGFGRSYNPEAFYNVVNVVQTSSAGQGTSEYSTIQWENVLSYQKSINDHNIFAMLGTTLRNSFGSGLNGSRSNMQLEGWDNAWLMNGANDETQKTNGWMWEHRLVSFFGQARYDFDEKYMVTATLRYDGSSNFGPNNKFGLFPSAQVGWVVSEESFLNDSETVNFLKFRAAYGAVGNEAIGAFGYLDLIGQTVPYPLGDTQTPVPGFGQTRMSNPDLKWENATEFNVGVDFGMWQDQLVLNVDYYNRKRVDLLGVRPIPGYTGVGAPNFNLGTVKNEGVEVNLAYRNRENAFKYEIGGNFAYNDNRVTEVNNADGKIYGDGAFQYLGQMIMEVGHTLPYFYGFKTDGVFQNTGEVDAYVNEEGNRIQPNAQAGDIRYVDVDGDGQITDQDRTDIGSPVHPWTFGLTASADYKGFDFSMFWQGQQGAQMFNATQRLDLWEGQNFSARYLNRWTGEGSTNEFPRFTHTDPNNNYNYINDMVHLEDASYIRLKNIQLGYTLPIKASKKIGMSKLRFYAAVNNAFTFTKYSGLDPEIGHGNTMGLGFDRGAYPQARMYMFGANIAF